MEDRAYIAVSLRQFSIMFLCKFQRGHIVFLKTLGIWSQAIHSKQGQGHQIQNVAEEAGQPQNNLSCETDDFFFYLNLLIHLLSVF